MTNGLTSPPTMSPNEIENYVSQAIIDTITIFREHPHYFFTESDIITHVCQCISHICQEWSNDRLESHCGNHLINLVHREYPTNFRYDKDKLLAMPEPYSLSSKKGKRGNFDLVVLNPEFVQHAPLAAVINKDIRYLEKRIDNICGELVVALEFKYILSNNKSYIEEIRKDSQKLLFAKHHGVRQVINLIFCNVELTEEMSKDVISAVTQASPGVTCVFIHAYYKAEEKVTPQCLIQRNNGAIEHAVTNFFDMLPIKDDTDPFDY